jgi:hypothetical protein
MCVCVCVFIYIYIIRHRAAEQPRYYISLKILNGDYDNGRLKCWWCKLEEVLNNGGVLLNTHEFASQYISTVILDKCNFFKGSTTTNQFGP